MSISKTDSIPFDIVEATKRAAQVTLWLHTMLGNKSLTLEYKLNAVNKAIIGSFDYSQLKDMTERHLKLYLSRLSRLSGRTMVFPAWLEPLWTLWQAVRAQEPPRDLTEEELAQCASRDVNSE